eukprot:3199851-Prymnesium_polylepis.1
MTWGARALILPRSRRSCVDPDVVLLFLECGLRPKRIVIVLILPSVERPCRTVHLCIRWCARSVPNASSDQQPCARCSG